MKAPKKITGNRVELLPAQAEHAEFLLRLRNAPHKSQFLQQGASTLEQQKAWMREQDALGKHIYFVAYDKATQLPIGSVRIYDEQADCSSISIGSWVILDDTPARLSLEVLALAVQYVGFLGFENIHFGVHRNNTSSIKFHSQLGVQNSGANAHEIIFRTTPENFLQGLLTRYRLQLPPIASIDL